MSKLTNIFTQFETTIKKSSPEIATGLGIGLGGCTVFLAVKATPKALMLMEEKKREINHDILESAKENGEETAERITKLKPIDVVKTTWKCYIPAAVTATVSVGCLIGANRTSARRNAALAAAYTISETALSEYKEKVIETIGEKKEKTVREAVAKSRLEKNPIENKEIVITGTGEVTCYDVWSGRYFKSDRNTLERVVNELNKRMIDSFNSYISLNEFYYAIGLSATKIGNELGWRLDGDKKLIEIEYDTNIASDGTPCLVIDFKTRPEYGFDTWM